MSSAVIATDETKERDADVSISVSILPPLKMLTIWILQVLNDLHVAASRIDSFSLHLISAALRGKWTCILKSCYSKSSGPLCSDCWAQPIAFSAKASSDMLNQSLWPKYKRVWSLPRIANEHKLQHSRCISEWQVIDDEG